MSSSRYRALALAAFIITGLAACAAIPPQSVQLSNLVGQDLLAIKKSHVFYVNSFYDRIEFEANRAIDNEYTPALIGGELRGPAGKTLITSLQQGAQGGVAANRALDFLGLFLKDADEQISAERKRVLTPIESARVAALSQIDSAYDNVVQANTTITAYLTSLQKLRAAQDELLANAGVPNLQDDVANSIAETSDKIDF